MFCLYIDISWPQTQSESDYSRVASWMIAASTLMSESYYRYYYRYRSRVNMVTRVTVSRGRWTVVPGVIFTIVATVMYEIIRVKMHYFSTNMPPFFSLLQTVWVDSIFDIYLLHLYRYVQNRYVLSRPSLWHILRLSQYFTAFHLRFLSHCLHYYRGSVIFLVVIHILSRATL